MVQFFLTYSLSITEVFVILRFDRGIQNILKTRLSGLRGNGALFPKTSCMDRQEQT